MPQAVIFDFRDTLIAVKAAYVQANERLFQDLKGLGLNLDLPAFLALAAPLVSKVKQAHINSPNFHDGTSAFIHRVLEVLKFPVPREDFERLCISYDKKFAETVTIYSDAEIILPRLKAADFKLGVIIDGTARRERRILERLQLGETFDAVIISEEIGENKTTNKPLWTALQRLHLDPAGVVVVGDKEDEDIAPAKAMGCRAILLSRAGGRYALNDLKNTQADAVAGSLLEVEKIIRSWTFSHLEVRALAAA